MCQPLVILASSRKFGGICLAGKRVGSGEWVRPVSVQPGQAWSVRSLQILAGGVPRVGELYTMPLRKRVPSSYQRENVSVGFERWHTSGLVSEHELTSLVDRPAKLWLDGWSSVSGWNDRIPEPLAIRHCDSSLMLIRPKALHFRLDLSHGNLSLCAAFDYLGQHYDLKVTDERASGRWIERLTEGHNGRTDGLLCISLSQAYHGYCYKLVAGVIELPGQEGPT